MEENKIQKVNRVLGIYTRLLNGYIVDKLEEAQRYCVNEKSIQRDIEDIREYCDLNLDEFGNYNSVVYDRSEKGYRLEYINRMKLSNAEILAVCKIMLDSRSFTKQEMSSMLRKLINCCVPEKEQKLVRELIANEEYHYVEPRHQTVFIDKLWDIGQACKGNRYLEIKYKRLKDKATVTRKIKPMAIMFSEYYFYLTAFIENEDVKNDFEVINDMYPTIYRIDRIVSLELLDETFRVPYSDRFEEGEFRKRIQFMYGGKLRSIKFEYIGYSVEAILDRLPTAKILSEEDGKYLIQAEVFGDGINMWLRSQGENIKLIDETLFMS